MNPWRKLVATLFAASSILLNGQGAQATAVVTPVSQDTQQCLRSATQLAADDYRMRRRDILRAYEAATRRERSQLRAELGQARSDGERRAAWRRYQSATSAVRADAQARVRQARLTFRASVAATRSQLGVDQIGVDRP